MACLEEAMYFETIKLVTVKNWKLGLINRLLQVAVLVYIAVYAIWYNRGYQKTSPIEGVLFIKVKGLAKDQNGEIYDSSDLVVPPTENNALFIATRALHTTQHENSRCVDKDPSNNCTTTAGCVDGNQTPNGYVYPYCNTTYNRCDIMGWCPVEDESPDVPLVEFQGVDSWTIFLRSHVTYSYFGVTANNADKTKPGYNIFAIKDMLKNENLTEIHRVGAIINVKIDWSCDLDKGIPSCGASYSYIRTDNGGNGSIGFNYRYVIYTGDPNNYNNNKNNNNNVDVPGIFSERVLTKLYGIRFIFHIDGIGRRFDVPTTVITIGSAAAFFGVATIFTDFILQYLHPRKQAFDHAKREPVDLGDVNGEPTESTKLV